MSREATESKLSKSIEGAWESFQNAESIDQAAYRKAIVSATQSTFASEFYDSCKSELLKFLDATDIDEEELNELASEEATQQASELGLGMAETTDGWVENGTHSDYAFSDTRADTVAITEVTRARTLGLLAAKEILKEIDIETLAVWITRLDERVCPVCGPLHNKDERTWSDMFPQGTPAHPNCRCMLSLKEKSRRRRSVGRLRSPARREPGKRIRSRFSRLLRPSFVRT